VVSKPDSHGFPHQLKPVAASYGDEELPAEQLFASIIAEACNAGNQRCKQVDLKFQTPDGSQISLTFGTGLAGLIISIIEALVILCLVIYIVRQNRQRARMVGHLALDAGNPAGVRGGDAPRDGTALPQPQPDQEQQQQQQQQNNEQDIYPNLPDKNYSPSLRTAASELDLESAPPPYWCGPREFVRKMWAMQQQLKRFYLDLLHELVSLA